MGHAAVDAAGGGGVITLVSAQPHKPVFRLDPGVPEWCCGA